MSQYIRFGRFAFVWLVILLVARLILGATGVPYEQGTWFFSMVVFTNMASLFYGAFSRGRGFKWYQACFQGMTIALFAQSLILLATVGSYLVGAETYFNARQALNVEEAIGLGQAIGVRVFGLVVNSIINGIVGLIGWAMGKLIPPA